VGIGTTTPTAELDIIKSVAGAGAVDIGLNIRMGTNATTVIGGNAIAGTSSTENIGLQGWGYGAERNWGVRVLSDNPANSGSIVTGVYGYADGGNNLAPQQIRGVWGVATGNFNGGPGFAGWFDGLTHCTAGVWTSSDAMLKENIEDLPTALPVIMQLEPKSYNFQADDFPSLGLDDATHFGFIAQDVEALLPEVVMDVQQPAMYDPAGNELAAAVEYKIMNYEMLIPWLAKGMQEQQAIIDVQNDRIDQLEAIVAGCCAGNPSDAGGMMAPQGQGSGNTLGTGLKERGFNDDDLRIVPNPMVDRTTISYTLADPGQARLVVSTSEGRQLRVLEEGAR
jgi:hypothetical protein